MTQLRVLPDTGVLLAMVVFPRDRTGSTSLAGEVLALYEARAFDLVLARAVVDELDEVLATRFPRQRARAIQLMRPLLDDLVRWPTPEEIAAALPHSTDPADAPIFASALIARPDVMLANDFQAFHTPAAKALWAQHSIEVESLFGLLCRLGKRERKR